MIDLDKENNVDKTRKLKRNRKETYNFNFLLCSNKSNKFWKILYYIIIIETWSRIYNLSLTLLLLFVYDIKRCMHNEVTRKNI